MILLFLWLTPGFLAALLWFAFAYYGDNDVFTVNEMVMILVMTITPILNYLVLYWMFCNLLNIRK